MSSERVARYVVIGIGVALVTAMALVLTIKPGARPDISARVAAVQIGDPKSLRVTLSIEKAPLAEGRCEVSAFDADGKSVGRLTNIVVPPNGANQRIVEMAVIVPTTDPAVTARIPSCRITRTR